MDFDSLQDDGAAQAPAEAAPQAAPTAPAAPVQFDDLKDDGAAASGALPKFDDLQDDQDKYSTPGEQALTVGENAAKGIGGFAATGIERLASAGAGALGLNNIAQELSPEAQEARAKTNPIEAKTAEYGSLAGSFLVGTGEAGVVMKAGEWALATKAGQALAEFSQFPKLGSAVIKGLVEGGLLGGSDAASDVINGQVDPERPAASALAHVGAGIASGSITGGLTGGLFDLGAAGAGKTLQAISDTRAGQGLSKLFDDFSARWGLNHISTPEAMTKELTNLHQATTDATNNLWGDTGLKSQAIDKLGADVSAEQAAKHVSNISDFIDNAPNSLKNYEPFQDAVEKWKSKVNFQPGNDSMTGAPIQSPTSAADIFKATNEFKQSIGDYAFTQGRPSPSDLPIVNSAKAAYGALKDSLEDTKTWGKLGQLQTDVNAATKNFIPSLEDFNSKATTAVRFDENGNPTNIKNKLVNPDRINTLYNGISKGKKELESQILGNFTKTAPDYINQVNKLYNDLGLEGSIRNTPLDRTTEFLNGKTSSGAQMADWMRHIGAPSLTTKLAETITGVEAGAKMGGIPGAAAGLALTHVLPWLTQAIGRPIKEYAIPTVMKALAAGSPRSIGDALAHVDNVYKGQKAMQMGVNSLFTGGKFAAIKNPPDFIKDKIKNFVEGGGVNQQIQNQNTINNQTQAPVPGQAFAKGGEVLPDVGHSEPAQEGPTSKLGAVFPKQDMIMNSARTRVYNYLNSMQPQKVQQNLPYDDHTKDPEADRRYDKALNIAGSPLSIINHIKDGSLDPEKLQHMKQLWPEIHNQLSKQMMEKVTKGQLKGEQKPPYKVRQAMSLFMGGNLDSSLTPAAIQAAQATFMQSGAPPQNAPVTKNKKNTSKLGEASGQYRTAEQGAQARQSQTKV